MGNRIFSTGTLIATIPNPAYTGGAAVTITVAGAGDNAYNGTYTQIGGQTHGGYPVYSSGTGHYLYNNIHAGWSLFTTVDDTSTPAYYGGGSDANPNSAVGAYAGGDTAPAPTVTGYGSGAVPPTLSIAFANLQSTTFDLMSQQKDLWQPAMVSMFPDKRVFYGTHLTGKSKIATISAAALQILTGSTPSGGTPNISTIGKTVVLPSFSAVFSTLDTNAVPIVMSVGNVTCPGLSLPFALEDFLLPDFSIDCQADGTGTVAKIQIG